MGASDASRPRPLAWVILISAVIVGCWVLPPFHVVRLAPANARPAKMEAGAFDAAAVARRLWQESIPAAAAQATDVGVVVTALRQNPEVARTKFGQAAGVGAAYFFVRGRGRVTARERNQVLIAPEGAPGEVVALRIGPVFGNTVRDGCGLLDLNSFPGLAEFNALAAELNALVEQKAMPPLREKAQVGTTVRFAGCAEAPESLDDPGEPVLTIVPVEARVP